MIYLTLFYNFVGLVGSLFILAYCLVQVFDNSIDDGCFGRILYLAIATCCIAALLHMVQGAPPQRTINTLLAFVGAAMIRRTVIATTAWARWREKWFIMVKQARAHNRSDK